MDVEEEREKRRMCCESVVEEEREALCEKVVQFFCMCKKVEKRSLAQNKRGH